MKKRWVVLTAFFTSLLILAVSSATTLAQTEAQINLRLSKIIGYYSGFLSSQLEAQGTLLLTADAPSDVTRITFYIDGDTVMGEANQAPFRLQFNSGSYSLGTHTLRALGLTSDGRQVESNQITVKFVTAGVGFNAGLRIALPIVGIALAAILLSFGATLFTRRKLVDLPPGTQRNYGVSGGAICSRCGRPFAIHALAPNLGFGSKLERCPYCGKFGIFRRKPLNELRAAEAAELKAAHAGDQVPEMSEEEKLRRDLDASRYQDR